MSRIGFMARVRCNVNLPMTGLRSFTPDEIVKHVPQLKALLLMRQMIQELQGQIDNQSGLRKEVQQIFADKDALAALRKELEPFGSPSSCRTTSLPAAMQLEKRSNPDRSRGSAPWLQQPK
jgi:hypothetical protein